MTTPLNIAPAAGSKSRKLALQMAIGAMVGGGATYGLLAAVGKSGFDMDDPSRVVALMIGLLFALIGVIVGLGTMAPTSGAHLLNVEDADELREQRRQLVRGSVVMLLIGGAMLALAAVDGSDGILPASTAGIIVAVCIIGVAALSFAGRGENDELMQAVATEASAVAMYATFGVVSVWAALSHLGYVAWIEPLGLLAALLALQLAAIFWVSAKRGMLRPR